MGIQLLTLDCKYCFKAKAVTTGTEYWSYKKSIHYDQKESNKEIGLSLLPSNLALLAFTL